ncbi:hypothetical protein GLAREA_08845 [Glarea lozoyensis ATCC 20868]|uniref:Uncharacterized protein n=1 Tax=Glarea lozoyensis (strain ATCC 20868 / MF5171) TaxID=1116229 RepID=S3DE34_GLAL2|nr:uncharacterized protein GLAREA_08845 [Glarea lozoyensis ATCC 20868]EPE36682.1 hypothetical protein GLAREA_08845 [Glarea lozoyensis ATCC 20868]
MDDPSIQETPFVKQLAANDRPTRDAALDSLRTYLSGRRTLTPLDLLKLHKGLFYSLWLCDRPIPQQNLATALANLLPILPTETFIPFLRAFWATMSREWNNIDVLRMEKFLLVVRRYVGSTFNVLKDGGWEAGRVEEVLGMMGETALSVEDMKVPMGLRFHVIDIWVDELEKVGALEDTEEDRKVQDMIMAPILALRERSPTKTVRMKAREALNDERIPGNERPVVEEEAADGEWAGFKD